MQTGRVLPASTPCAVQSRRLLSGQVLAPSRLLCSQPCRQEQRRHSHNVACSASATVEAPSIASKGPDYWNTTYYPTGGDASPLKKTWYVVDAEGQTLGRLATLVASTIRGKTSPTYQPSMDMGSYVVIINAEKVKVTGNKEQQKMYYRHTGRPGSLKEENFRKLQARLPERIVEKAVKGMLPSGRIGRHLFTHLKVYKGGAHPHSAQQPSDITSKINMKPGAESTPAQ